MTRLRVVFREKTIGKRVRFPHCRATVSECCSRAPATAILGSWEGQAQVDSREPGDRRKTQIIIQRPFACKGVSVMPSVIARCFRAFLVFTLATLFLQAAELSVTVVDPQGSRVPHAQI